ncbi:MAG: cyclic nucleotide-binding domain-containing protein [Gammaproteobacteria bacterium]|nr:cyclic nucleotide-binding domain-containing protein [Gammaproteobacteria bacterium]
MRELTSGRMLFRDGDRDNRTYFLISGVLELLHNGRPVLTLRGGSPEARNAVAPSNPRRYSARVVSERIEYLALDSDMLDLMLTWDQTGIYEVNELRSLDEDSPASADWMTALLQTKAFHRIPPANLQAVFMRMQRLDYPAGEHIIRQGDEGDYFYAIVKGTCTVLRETPLNKGGIKLADLNMGDTFGEEALISEAKRNANVLASTDVTLMRLGKQDFRTLLNEPMLQWVENARGSGHRGTRRQMARRAPAERIRESSSRRCHQRAAVFHSSQAQVARAQSPICGVLRHGAPQLGGCLYSRRARLSCERAQGRAAAAGVNRSGETAGSAGITGHFQHFV